MLRVVLRTRPLARRVGRVTSTSISARAERRQSLLVPQAPSDLHSVGEADKFLRRYLLDTLARIKEFQHVRLPSRVADVVHGDAPEIDLGGAFDAVVTVAGRIRGSSTTTSSIATRTSFSSSTTAANENGIAAARGRVGSLFAEYADGILSVLSNCLPALDGRAPVIVVVNDRLDLYPEILERAGLRVVERLSAHVNRRTGRRSGEYFGIGCFVASRSGYLAVENR